MERGVVKVNSKIRKEDTGMNNSMEEFDASGSGKAKYIWPYDFVIGRAGRKVKIIFFFLFVTVFLIVLFEERRNQEEVERIYACEGREDGNDNDYEGDEGKNKVLLPADTF